MELKIRCPQCNRCIGIFSFTDQKNSIFEVSKKPFAEIKRNDYCFHSTCLRCKKEIYVLMGFKEED